MRVLVTVSPRMYREAIALSIRRDRPGLDVRVAPPEDAEREIGALGPRLLVYNDTAPIAEGTLAAVPCRLEVLYTDSMDARVHGACADGAGPRGDASLEDLLLRVVDAADREGRGA